MAWLQDELGNWYNDEPGYVYNDNVDAGGGFNPGGTSDWYDTFLQSIGVNPSTATGPGASPSNAQIASSIGLGGSSTLSGIQNLLKSVTGGSGTESQLMALVPLLGGMYAASQSNKRTQPAGYQGGIPQYTATRQAPASGQRLSGNVTYTKKAEGGELETGGFVIPADVVSHFGNGSSDAGLKVLAAKLGAEPIKGDGDGMSDSIPTTIDGKEKALVAHEEAYVSPDKVAQIGGGDAKRGAKKLREMMDRIREARTGSAEQGKQINPTKFVPGGEVKGYADGGSTAPSSSAISSGLTGVESSLSNWAGPYVTDMLAKGQALSEMPFEQYSGPLTAGPSALQTQAFNTAANLQTPAAIGQAAATAGGLASAFQNLGYTPSGGPAYTPITAGNVASSFQAPSAYQTGQFTNQFASPGVTSATQFTNQYTAPSAYQTGQFGTKEFGGTEAARYMNPYLETSLVPQLAELQRQNKMAINEQLGKLTQAGAYGGGRQAVLQAENTRNLMDKLAQVTGQGYNTAYQNAMSQFNADQARQQQVQQAIEQSRQFGANQAMTAAQLQAQYGLSAEQAQEAARQFNQGQAMTAAQLQAQYGLSAQQAQEASRQFGAQQGLTAATTAGQQGLQAAMANQQAGLTAQQANINAALQAAQQAEQSRQFGANYGLQGLQSALQAAQTQGSLGLSQQQADLAGLNALATLGATQRGISAEDIAAQKAAFEEARANPYKMVQFQQSLLSGLPLAAQTYNLSDTNNLSQFMGGLATASDLLKRLGQAGNTATGNP